MKEGLFVGVDVGGTFTKLAAVRRGRLAGRGVFPTSPQFGPRRFLDRLAAEVRRLARSAGVPLAGAGVGIAGDVDGGRGLLRYSPNLEGWENVRLSRPLSRALGCRVVVENDANVAAWGLYVLELRRRVRHMLAVTLGTGVGGGLVIDGRLHSGAWGTAGEIGHTTVFPDGDPCPCGARGHLEAYAGGRGLVRRFFELSGRGGESLTPEALASLARRGDPHAIEVWRSAGEALGLAVANAAFLVNPETVVLTGGVARARDLFLPALRKALSKGSFTTPVKRLKIRVSRRADPGAFGAAVLASESRA